MSEHLRISTKLDSGPVVGFIVMFESAALHYSGQVAEQCVLLWLAAVNRLGNCEGYETAFAVENSAKSTLAIHSLIRSLSMLGEHEEDDEQARNTT